MALFVCCVVSPAMSAKNFNVYVLYYALTLKDTFEVIHAKVIIKEITVSV